MEEAKQAELKDMINKTRDHNSEKALSESDSHTTTEDIGTPSHTLSKNFASNPIATLQS